MSKTSRRAASKRRSAARKHADKLREVLASLPSHVTVTEMNTEAWDQLVKEDESYANARSIVMALMGEGQELRSTAFQDQDPEEVADHFLNLVSDPELIPIEEKFRKKFGSYKARPFPEWADKVVSLWKPTTWDPDYTILERAKARVIGEIKEGLSHMADSVLIDPLTIDDATMKVTKGRNSGWPHYTSKWSSNPEMTYFYKQQARLLIEGNDTLHGRPHILFKRVQTDGVLTPKMRAVECPPKHDAIAAKCFTDRFIDVFKTMDPYCGFNGGENVYQYLNSFMSYEYLIEGDFSSFDQNCQQIMGHAFDVIRAVTPERYHPYLESVQDYYQHSKLITPMGLLEGTKINGLNSGDGWTSVIGTLSNSISVLYALERMNVTDFERLAFGDDIAIATNDEFSLEEFAQAMIELGQECNPNKQGITSGPNAHFSFLGFYHFRNRWKAGNEGIFPISRLVPGLVYRERLISCGELARKSGIPKENYDDLNKEGVEMMGYAMKLNVARNHPNHREFVKYFRENEPNRMNPLMILPFKDLEEALRIGRQSRKTALVNSPTMQLLSLLHAMDHHSVI